MKTPEKLLNEPFPFDQMEGWDNAVAWIEAIQHDALTDTMADSTAQEEFEMTKSMCKSLEEQVEFWKEKAQEMRDKWHEARRYLRAANKGAQRNAEALELAQLRLLKYIQGVKEDGTNARCWKWLSMNDSEIRLHMGELTAQEIRTIRACLRAILGTSQLSKQTNQ